MFFSFGEVNKVGRLDCNYGVLAMTTLQVLIQRRTNGRVVQMLSVSERNDTDFNFNLVFWTLDYVETIGNVYSQLVRMQGQTFLSRSYRAPYQLNPMSDLSLDRFREPI